MHTEDNISFVVFALYSIIIMYAVEIYLIVDRHVVKNVVKLSPRNVWRTQIRVSPGGHRRAQDSNGLRLQVD